jgi:hypothetical protein
MDRGKRRERDEAYVKWLKLQYKHRCFTRGWQPRWWDWTLGAKKVILFPCKCSKKTPGRPKRAHGCCCGVSDSPKIARNRWRRDKDLWE